MRNKSCAAGPAVREAERLYSPAAFAGSTKIAKIGIPFPHLVSTSQVERANLSMRMNMRRFTRLTNGFSKKIENHMHAVSFFFMVYDFCRVHATTKKAPAFAAGVSTFQSTIEDIVMMADTVTFESAD